MTTTFIRLLAIAAVLMAPAASARDGDETDHQGRSAAVTMTGTVISIGREGFGLDTGSGIVRVEIERTTVLTRNGQPAGAGDLAVGQSVTVKGRLERNELEARTVDIHSGVTLSGVIQSLAPPALNVSGTPVVTTAATVFTRNGAPAAFADLRIGDQVTVSGIPQADASVLATRVVATSGITLSGVVEALAPPGFTVSGTPVVTTAATVFTRNGAPAAFADLRIGDQVSVSGTVQADGTVLASSVTVTSLVTLSGVVLSISPPSLTVSGATVVTDAATVITVAGAPGTLADLRVGDTVTVTGTAQADGTTLAQTLTRP